MLRINKILIIAAREYNAVVRSKAFVVSIVLLPIMMFGSIAVMQFSKNVRDINDRRFAVIDRTPGEIVYSQLQKDVAEYNRGAVDPNTKQQTHGRFILEEVKPANGKSAIDRQRLELSDRVRSGNLSGFVEIGSDILTPLIVSPTSSVSPDDSQIVRYQTRTPTFFEFRNLAKQSIDTAVRNQRLDAAKISPGVFQKLAAPVSIVNEGLAQRNSDGKIIYGKASNDIASILVPIGLMLLMFMVVVIGAMPLLQGIVEEKQQRIAEVLLGSVSPFSLMAGKVMGMVATSFTLLVVYLGGAYWVSRRINFAEYLPAHLVLWFVLFNSLAVLMYGSLYIAIGASCTDTKEMQSLLMPVNLLMAMPLMMMVMIIQSPSGPLARIMTYFPPATPFVAVARLAVPPGIGWTEISLAIGMVIATTIVLVWASGRIFRVGILMQGKGANLSQLFKWVVSG